VSCSRSVVLADICIIIFFVPTDEKILLEYPLQNELFLKLQPAIIFAGL
jgi:hypothetical protein